MRVTERAVYRGPHLYSQRPTVRIQLDLGELERWPTDRLPGFAAALVERLPGLAAHGCSLKHAGGLLERMRDGTWLGHVIEHVALEIQTMAGARTTRGKTRSVKGRPGVYNVMYVYEDEAAGLLAGRLAVELVVSLLPEFLRGVEGLDRIAAGAASFEEGVDTVRTLLRRSAFGPSTAALVSAARRRGIPVQRMNEHSLLQLGWGARQRRIRASATDRTGLIAAESAGDKSEAKALMQSVGLPVAAGGVATSPEGLLREAARLRRPLVVKPLGGNHGRGVTTGLMTDTELEAAFTRAARHGRRVLVEEQLHGRDHRILVVDGAVVAVAERTPAFVVGDGHRTVRALIAQTNEDPRRGEGHGSVLTRIAIDEPLEAALAGNGLTLDAVPDAGRRVQLRDTANLSTGGTAIDRTDEIHPDNAAIARRAARVLGLDVAGVDLLAPDISKSVRETGGGIVEVNAAPGLRMHLEPSEGLGRDVAGPIIDMLFPRGTRARIPVLAVTGTNGKSTVGRMLSHMFAAQGRTVGLTNTSGVYIGDEQVTRGDASGPRSARMVLRDPTVEVAVLECARGGTLREGLAFDRCDVGAVLNVSPDHLGLKGVLTLDDLAAVKSVVVESVSRRGLSVLNADDPLTIRMARHAGGRVGWFSIRGGDGCPGFLLRHIHDGGAAAIYDGDTGELTLWDKGVATGICKARDIPATFGGAAVFNVQNALAASLMAHGAGLDSSTITGALKGFSSTFEQNPGRMNVFDDHGFRVILDYAHNPEALASLGRMVAAIRPEGRRSIAMISIPGDRRDEEIRAMGAIGAEYFDTLVFRETPDARGRRRGEVMRLLCEGASETGCDRRRIHSVYEEDDAARAAMGMAKEGDVVVLMPTRVEQVWDLVRDFRASPPDPNNDIILEPAHG